MLDKSAKEPDAAYREDSFPPCHPDALTSVPRTVMNGAQLKLCVKITEVQDLGYLKIKRQDKPEIVKEKKIEHIYKPFVQHADARKQQTHISMWTSYMDFLLFILLVPYHFFLRTD